MVPQFTEHYFDEDDSGDDSIDNGPTGGLTWDGRVDRGRDQARIPLFSSYEMANRNKQSVVTAAQEGSYSPELRKLSGGSADASAVLDTILEALESREGGIIESSIRTAVKYDAWLAGKAELNAAELRGLKFFTDPKKGNCARCHIATRGVNSTPPQFTDYGFVALGVPRNNQIPANSNLQ